MNLVIQFFNQNMNFQDTRTEATSFYLLIHVSYLILILDNVKMSNIDNRFEFEGPIIKIYDR